MRETMIRLLKESRSCVLATCSRNQPHCSLMAYLTDESGQTVYMITQRGSRKFQNMQENPLVSLLVDTRERGETPHMSPVRALTVYGRFQSLEDGTKREEILRRLLDGHPHLSALAAYPDAEVFAIRLQSFLLLDGVTDAYFENLQ
ncbi:MAG: pyridoxamine 5'-phosphate oxidase family protein [Deltaproteobacteria bacterium]|nr:pyridoxamine 5'-phosphate oxidase family protein [Deltaproteobacteria bacterium]